MVRHRIDRDKPPSEILLEYGDGVLIENNNDKLIYQELFDGATLLARYVKITVYVNDNKRVQSLNVSWVRYDSYI